jgi:hypothetical protein
VEAEPTTGLSDLGAAAHAVADLVKRRRRVPHDEAVGLAGPKAVLVARARGLVRLEGFGRHAELVPGNVSMFEPGWHGKSLRGGRWRSSDRESKPPR